MSKQKNVPVEDLEATQPEPEFEPAPEPTSEGEPVPESDKPESPEETAEPTEITTAEPPTEEETEEVKARVAGETPEQEGLGQVVQATKLTVEILQTIERLRSYIREAGPGRSVDVALVKLDEVELWARDASRPAATPE